MDTIGPVIRTIAQSVCAETWDVIVQRGWFQEDNPVGDGKGPNGEVCLDVALMVACRSVVGDDYTASSRAYDLALTLIRNELGVPQHNALGHIFWNDAPTTKLDDVYGLLDLCAKP